jgi:Putative transposase
LLFDVAAETLRTIAADPKHLGARIGTTLVLHTWGSALTHHPHVHGIVPGGGLAPDADRWVPCKPGFFLSVRVLSRLFRRRFLEELQNRRRDGQLKFFGDHFLLHQPPPTPPAEPGDGSADHRCPRPTFVCRHCGAPMLVIETFARAQHIRGPPGSSLSP